VCVSILYMRTSGNQAASVGPQADRYVTRVCWYSVYAPACLYQLDRYVFFSLCFFFFMQSE
jgi:hypothetical protein